MLPIELHLRRHRRSALPSEVLLLVRAVAQRQLVVAVCQTGLAQGITPGMAVSDAKAVLRGSVQIATHDPLRDAKALTAIAMWARRFSPIVAADLPDGLLLDVTGCAHLFGGEQAMLGRVESDFRALGMTTSATIAPSFGSARAAARFGAAGSIIAPHNIREALGLLPLQSLGIDPSAIDGMGEVGIKAVHELLALPRGSIAARFGDGVLRRVDQVLGRLPEVIEPIRPVDPPHAEQLFAGPCCCVETIGVACQGVLERVCMELVRRGKGLTDARITLLRSDLQPLNLPLRLSAASRDPSHLWSLLRPRIERAHLGFGVEGVRITATRLGALREEQQRWWNDAEQTADSNTALDQLLDTLINRLGKDNVLRPHLVESHLPERSFRLLSVLDAGASCSAGTIDADRPTLLYDRPNPIEVIALTPDGPVSRFGWEARNHAIRSCIGPERIASEWWHRERFTRDYYKVQDESGRWFWLFCDLDARLWFVHGVWA